jgi:hypothetical protein
MTGAEYMALRVALDRVDKADEAVFATAPVELPAQLQTANAAYYHLAATVRKVIERHTKDDRPHVRRKP